MVFKNWSKILGLKTNFLNKIFGLVLAIFLIVCSAESRPVDTDVDGNLLQNDGI